MNEKEQVLDSLIKENTSKEIDTTTKELNQIPKRQDLFDLKLGEELNDAEHSRRNTELLNKRYSEILKFLFGIGFYPILILLLILFFISDKHLMDICDLNEYTILIANKLLQIFGIIFMILLSFPTAKGLRRLFKGIIEYITRKK